MINLYQGKAITTKADIWVGTEHKHTNTHTHSPQSLSPSSPPTHSLLFLSFSLSHMSFSSTLHKLESWFSQTDTADTDAKPVSSINEVSQGCALQPSLKSWLCFKIDRFVDVLLLCHEKSRHTSGCGGVEISRFCFFKYCTKTCLLELRSGVMCMWA